MKNYGRVLRLALKRRFTFAASVFCAVMVGVLWGGNIAVIYPFIEVVFPGDNLQTWSQDRIDAAQAEIASQHALQAELEAALGQPGADQRAIEKDLSAVRRRLEVEQAALARQQWMHPYIVKYLPQDAFMTLVWVIAFLMAGTLLKSAFLVVNQVLVSRMAQLAAYDLRNECYEHTLSLDQAFFSKDGTSDLMSRFTHDMENIVNGLRLLLGKAVREPVKMIVCLIGAAWICWRLLAFSLLIAPIAALLINALAKSLRRANRRAMEGMTQIYTIHDETLGGIKIVKAFTSEPHERRRFRERNDQYFARSMKIAFYDALTSPLTEAMGIITISLALLAGAWLVLEDQTHLFNIRMSDRPLDIGTLILFYGLLAGTSDPARKLSDIFNRVQRAAAASDRVYGIIDRSPTVADPAQPVRTQRHHREVSFAGVDFAYTPETMVLEGIDLRIPFGETIALVGPNGCGKSTLASMVPRFFDPVQGMVQIDGVDLRQMALRDLRQQIGLVTQETLLFNDSVLENIRYGTPEATRDDVVEAARRAHADRFITERLANGYDTIVGPRGGQLSGGQRQRIALARAILRDPAILILDEATSQIDLESEQAIHAVLEDFIRDRTTIVITHRTGILAMADRIVVMEGGRIGDVGTHGELHERCALYRSLADLRSGAA